MARRTAVALLSTAILMGPLAGAAVAGEVTGSGKSTPIREWRAASICAFSGLNDTWSGDPEVPDEDGFTRTQSWGQVPKEVRAMVRAGTFPDPHVAPPNVACNPSGSR